jgi:putative ABC transport system ATP-binding protein
MLSVRNLCKSFSGPRAKSVLQDVNLDLAAGDYVAVTGESGVGKSTLLNLIAGLEQPDSGQVLFDEADLCMLDDDALTVIRRRHMGFVFQAFHILPYLTVAQNVGLPLALNGAPEAKVPERVAAMLDAVKLSDRAESLPRELSGGEMQRAAIARALVHKPRLVLADEPTGNLDPRTSDHVFAALTQLVQASGLAVVVATHNMDIAGRMDRRVTLRDGLVIELE